jgi:hypothetical protein
MIDCEYEQCRKVGAASRGLGACEPSGFGRVTSDRLFAHAGPLAKGRHPRWMFDLLRYRRRLDDVVGGSEEIDDTE